MNRIPERYLEFNNVSRDVIDWFEYTAEENNCRMEKQV